MLAPAAQLYLFPQMEVKVTPLKRQVTNVASVDQRSPFRYPGGKTWLVPTIRKWFSLAFADSHLVEPFAGGGIIALTAVAERYFNHVTMVELDDDVAATWQTILSDDCQWLKQQIIHFQVTAENVNLVIEQADKGIKERGFATIVRNRTNHGGILAKGSGHIKLGENGKGLGSRWYPATLVRRINDVYALRDKIEYIHGDAFDTIGQYINDEKTFFFIDPPYTIAGKRLYTHFEVDHLRLFELASRMKGHFLMTYDDTPEVRAWAKEFNLPFDTIPMQTTHLITKEELIISDSLDWLYQ